MMRMPHPCAPGKSGAPGSDLQEAADGLLDKVVAALECQGLASNGFTSPQSEPSHLPVIVVRELRGVSPTSHRDGLKCNFRNLENWLRRQPQRSILAHELCHFHAVRAASAESDLAIGLSFGPGRLRQQTRGCSKSGCFRRRPSPTRSFSSSLRYCARFSGLMFFRRSLASGCLLTVDLALDVDFPQSWFNGGVGGVVCACPASAAAATTKVVNTERRMEPCMRVFLIPANGSAELK